MEKPVALLVHSIGGDATNWDAVVPLFREVHPVTIDLPGHGQSSLPLRSSAQDYARHLEDVRIAMGCERIFAIGQSMGGAVVQSYAHAYPQACAGIVIASSAAHFSVSAERLRQIEDDWPAAQKEFAPRQVSARASEALKASARRLVARRDPHVMAQDLRICNGFSSVHWAKSVNAPVLVITGDEDPSYGPARAQELHSLYPNSQMTILERCGHNAVLEQPELFAAAIDAFVRSDVACQR